MSIIEQTKYQKRTPEVAIVRQLWPRPPLFARPQWLYINTLRFYAIGDGCDRICIWEQDIPEARFLGRAPRYNNVFNCRVYLDPKWGWMLRAEATHDDAKGFIEGMLTSLGRFDEELDV